MDPANLDLERCVGAVYAAPEDDAPRLALAAALTARGDARGEFIEIQVALARQAATAAQRQRANELLAQHKVTWLGRLATLVLHADVDFARGFPDGVTLSGEVRPPAAAELAAMPEWATVRELQVAFWPDPHVMAVIERAICARRVFGARGNQLGALGRCASLDTLQLMQPHERHILELACGEWPRLRVLMLELVPSQSRGPDPDMARVPARLAALWGEGGLGWRLQLCELYVLDGFGPWLDAIREGVVAAPVRVADHSSGWSIELERSGRLLVGPQDPAERFDLARLERALAGHVLDWVPALRLAATRSLTQDETTWLRRTFPAAEIDLGGISH